jgi:hypothetical protein
MSHHAPLIMFARFELRPSYSRRRASSQAGPHLDSRFRGNDVRRGFPVPQALNTTWMILKLAPIRFRSNVKSVPPDYKSSACFLLRDSFSAVTRIARLPLTGHSCSQTPQPMQRSGSTWGRCSRT